MGRARMALGSAAVVLLAVGGVGCAPYLHAVEDGAYGALVPTADQWDADRSDDLPGGFAALRADGVERVVLRIQGDTVRFELDGDIVETRAVRGRRDVQDSEGSGPFKAETQVLDLGADPLVLGSLVIRDPVIWYAGGYDSTQVVAVKPGDPDERGPIDQCTGDDEQCLVLPVGTTLVGDPAGEYTDVNDPTAGEYPLSSIRVSATQVTYVLDTGEEVSVSRDEEVLVRGCALWESAVWPVPAEVGLDLEEPVLVETSCPLPYGEAHSVTVMERDALPVLAPLATNRAGEWCHGGPECLLFLDEESAED